MLLYQGVEIFIPLLKDFIGRHSEYHVQAWHNFFEKERTVRNIRAEYLD